MRYTAILLAASACATPAWAGDKPLYGPAPAFVVAAPAPDLSKKDKVFLTLDNQQELRDGRVVDYHDTVSQVVSDQLLSTLGQVTLPWDPDKGDLTIHAVTILRGGETIDLLKQGKTFEVLRREEQLEQRAVTGLLTATMAVEGLRVGDVLRVAFSTSNTDRALAGQMQASGVTPTLPMPMDYGRVRLLWPKDRAIAWRGHADGLAAATKERDLGAMHEVTVALPLPKPVELPQDAPMRFAKLPIVEATTFADWPAVSRTMAPLFATEGLIPNGSALAKEIDAIIAAESDPVARAQRALRLVEDQIRYLAVSMNGGGYIPQPPAKTWEMRYGDCKAKTLLLLAMLHRMGITAEPALASAQAGGFVEKRLPAPQAFDHVLVRATIGDRVLWLDGTRTGDRLADIGNVPALTTVLPLRREGAGLLAVRATAPARPMMAVETVYDQSAGLWLPPVVDTTVRFTGPMAATLGTAVKVATPEQKREMANGVLRNIIGEAQFGDPTLTYDADQAAFTMKVRGVVSTPWQQREGRYRMALASLDDVLAFQTDRGRAAWRDLPVAIGEPARIVRRTIVILPPEARAATLDGQQAIDVDVAGRHVRRTATLAGGRLTIDDDLSSDGGEIAPAALAGERARLAKVKAAALTFVAPADLPNRAATIRTGGRARLAPLDRVFGDAVRTAPADASEALVSRASFRRGVYDFAGAIDDYTRAIAIEPAQSSLTARAELYNMTGQPAKALADWRTVHDRDPGDVTTVIGLAEQMSLTGDHAGALALVDERIAQGGDDRFAAMEAKAMILVRQGKAAEAVAVMDEAVAARPSQPGLLNSRCWVKAIGNVQLESALKDCTRSIELSDSPVGTLDSRGVVFFRLGRYAEALADFDAALAINQSMDQTRYMRGLARVKAGEAKPGADDIADAVLTNPSLPATYAAWGIRR